MYFCFVNTHHIYMQRCIDLANNGLGTTYPNPLVGCVIVANDRIIGEGWHRKAGQSHAEVLAIKSVKDHSLLDVATLYVNLEPCSHHGRTPPCADMIVASKIPNVVIGTTDPNPVVSGNGIKKLFDAGINVTVGVLEKECHLLNKRFFTFQLKQRPYVILKWAQTADGYIAPNKQAHHAARPHFISGSLSKQLVHKWRTEEAAILIGTNTAVADNPFLTAREYYGNHPVRIVLDRRLRISKENHIFDNQAKTIIVSESTIKHQYAVSETINFAENIAEQLADLMYRHNILSVIVEGGTKILQTFIDAHLWDEARIFKARSYLGDGVNAPEFKKTPIHNQRVGEDELSIFCNYDQHDNI